ncbi:hypothetical protein [Citrobacter sp. BIDMC108]|uniref:hypothetical protein n=1 Tax=Citrobacter sp. BIDMC108 TaxID=1686385 RepID=UPI000650D692|nr:hypothetical protein [Citrobacter sp. BIDMC108]
MRYLMFLAFFLSTASASAECWVVKDMKGVNSASHGDYNFEKDGFSGTFRISADGDKASVTYSGSDAGGLSYGHILPNTIIGVSNNENGQVVETWIIGKNGMVKMTKVINGFGDFDSVKAMVGKVVSKC